MPKTYTNEDLDQYGAVPPGITAIAEKYRKLSPVAASKQDALYVPPKPPTLDFDTADEARAALMLDVGPIGDAPDDVSDRVHTAWADPKKVFVDRGKAVASAAEGGTPASAVPQPPTGPRYRRVDNPYERESGGFTGTSMIATRDGQLVDLSREAGRVPGVGPSNKLTAVPGFNTQDLVDLYGPGAKSSLSDEENAALVAQRKTNLGNRVFTGYETDAQGNKRPVFTDITPKTAVPQLDFSSPQSMLASAIPMAIQIGQNKAKALRDQQNRQLFKDKYDIDLQRIEMGLKGPLYAAQTAHAQAEAKKAEAEAGVVRPKTREGGLLTDLIKEAYKNMTLLPEEEKEGAKKQINQWMQRLDEVEGGSAVPGAGGTSISLSPQQDTAIRQRIKEATAKGTPWATIESELRTKGLDPNNYRS